MSSTDFLNRTIVLTVICAALAAGCARYTTPGEPAPVASRERPLIAVLPVNNLSGKPAPLKEIRESLIQAVVRQGSPVMWDADLETFMSRHRVRYTGGIDTMTAAALREEAGVEAVLITALEQYAEGPPPKIALTARLVTSGEPPRILWIDTICIAGDESPGLFGLGLIHDVSVLREKALQRINVSLGKFFLDQAVKNKMDSDWLYEPKTAYLSRFLAPERKYTIAIVPFFNKSRTSNAGEILLLEFARQLSRDLDFDVIEPGIVREKLLFCRIIMTDGVSLADADLIFNSLKADFILTGKVLDYDDAPWDAPKVEFNAWVFNGKNKKVVWASRSENRGSDGVFFFDVGRIKTAGVLTSKMVESVVRAMSSKDPALLDDRSSKYGAFAFMKTDQK